MAFQRDYVLRLIEMMGDFFRRLGEMIDEKEQTRALDGACREQCGLSMEAACALSEQTVEELLPPQGILMLSELTYAQAMVTARDEEKKAALLLRTLRLLCMLWEEETLCAERAPRLKELMDACGDLLTPEDYLACARFLMAGEHFDWGEDAVFLSVEEAPAEDKHYYILQGVALFRGLLTLPDGTLAPGGLPRAEVLRAIDDLQAQEQA